MWNRETNENEPLMTYRKRKVTSKLGVQIWPGISSRGACLLLERCTVLRWRESILGSVWNVGTCRLNVKGEAQVEIPQEPEYQGEAQGRIGPY